MANSEIGFVELTPTTRIIFAVGSWKGRPRASIRKFIATEKYVGPTKSGLSLDGAVLVELLAALRTVQVTVPRNDQNQYISVGKTQDWEIRVAIIPPDENNELPNVDIREYIETEGYSGPLKAGVRFPWGKLKQFTQLTEVLVQQLQVTVQAETTLFPDVQPQWVRDAKKSASSDKDKFAPLGFDEFRKGLRDLKWSR